MTSRRIQNFGAEERHRMPTWVRGLIVVCLVAVIALVAVMILIGGDHGPGRHQAARGTDPRIAVSPVVRR
jgi:hypothetical protein